MELQREFVSNLQSRSLKFSGFLKSLESMDIESCRFDLLDGRLLFLSGDGVLCSEKITLDSKVGSKFKDGEVRQVILDNQSQNLSLQEFVARMMACGISSFTIYPEGRRVIYFGQKGDCCYEFIRSEPGDVRRPEPGISKALQ
ncbi:hypothetical protein ACLVWU_01355 [Bdellovibrio sp. HCB290]|uniref:hypothetical protein n=1 Tax=Bdellovibrio sp. HCB290 TaxID=3394356 RepID=UPI0039B394C9